VGDARAGEENTTSTIKIRPGQKNRVDDFGASQARATHRKEKPKVNAKTPADDLDGEEVLLEKGKGDIEQDCESPRGARSRAK